MLAVKVIIFLNLLYFLYGQNTNHTALEEGTAGANVVLAAIYLITISGAFAVDNNFLRRVAFVESRDGTAPETYREGYNGGIWQVDEAILRKTQNISNPLLTSSRGIYERLNASSLNLDWSHIVWRDMRIPLYSALAARIFFDIADSNIPAMEDVEAQAIFWKNSGFNTDNADTVNSFVEAIKELKLNGTITLRFDQTSYTVTEGENATVCLHIKKPGFQVNWIMYSIHSKDRTATLANGDYMEYTSQVVPLISNETLVSSFKVKTNDNDKIDPARYFILDLNFTVGTPSINITGTRQTNIVILNNDIKQDPCVSSNCHAQADCVNASSETFQCSCKRGFFGDGVLCMKEHCRTPSPPINGSLEVENMTFLCKSGFYPLQVMHALCLPTGVWSIDPGSVICRPVPTCDCPNSRGGMLSLGTQLDYDLNSASSDSTLVGLTIGVACGMIFYPIGIMIGFVGIFLYSLIYGSLMPLKDETVADSMVDASVPPQDQDGRAEQKEHSQQTGKPLNSFKHRPSLIEVMEPRRGSTYKPFSETTEEHSRTRPGKVIEPRRGSTYKSFSETTEEQSRTRPVKDNVATAHAERNHLQHYSRIRSTTTNEKNRAFAKPTKDSHASASRSPSRDHSQYGDQEKTVSTHPKEKLRYKTKPDPNEKILASPLSGVTLPSTHKVHLKPTSSFLGLGKETSIPQVGKYVYSSRDHATGLNHQPSKEPVNSSKDGVQRTRTDKSKHIPPKSKDNTPDSVKQKYISQGVDYTYTNITKQSSVQPTSTLASKKSKSKPSDEERTYTYITRK